MIGMAYQPYADKAYYLDTYQGDMPANRLEKALCQASRHVDSLTYNRITGLGFSNLTAFQQDIIREVVCLQADFEYENEDEINTILQSYSINGVSVQFGSSWNVFTDKGIAVKRDVYAMLCQTGLCCRIVG